MDQTTNQSGYHDPTAANQQQPPAQSDYTAFQLQQQSTEQQGSNQGNQAYYQAFSQQPQPGAPSSQQQPESYQAYQPMQQSTGEAPQSHQQPMRMDEQQYYPPPPSGPPPQQQSNFQAAPPVDMQGQQQHQQALGAQDQQYYPPPPPGPPPQQQFGYQPAPPVGTAAQASNDTTTLPQQGFYAPDTQSMSANVPPQPDQPTQQVGPINPQTGYQPPLPPRRKQHDWGTDDPSNPVHYTRDPHKLVAYLVPFPKPQLKGVDPSLIPDRFLIYTPPPPPLSKPKEGEKEDKLHKVQRKWQEEVREAKTSTAKTASWKGVKGKATKGIDWAMSKTTGSNLDFLNRIPGTSSSHSDTEGSDHEGETTKKTVGLEEMVLVYPSSVPGTQEQLREEFVNSMLRSKSKAQRDSIIATGLLPVSLAIDVLATLVWPFGGLVEIDSVWLYSSVRGAKTARTTTKRLTSSNHGTNTDAQLRLTFTPSQRLEVLRTYLASECRHKDSKLFAHAGATAPTETQVLEAIGWAPSQTSGETRNWEDEMWEVQETKEDTKRTFRKGAAEWEKWCKAFEKDPQKALKK